MTKQINAKFTSRCSACGSTINPGDLISYDPAVKYSSRHVTCPKKAKASAKPPAEKVFLNSAPVQTPQAQRLTDEQAAEILAKEGRQFVRALPEGKPTIGIGYTVSINGKDVSIGTCGEWVGIATDWKAEPPVEHVVSLIDGTVLETGEHRKTHGIGYWTRLLGAPDKREMGGKNSVKCGEIQRDKDGRSWLVTSVDKPYYLSADDAEDMDMFSRGGGWGTPYERREITLSEAERAADAEAAAKKAAAEALKNFERRITGLGADLEPSYSNRIETPREGVTTLRKWSTSNHPTYHSAYYRGVYAVQLADGRIGYRFTDSYYDWPQDYIAIVPEFFADEPAPTETC